MVLLSIPLLQGWTFLEILKLKTFDNFVAEQQPSNHFVTLDISEEDLDRFGGYPLPRDLLSQIQIELINEGAIGVGWYSFPQPDRFGGDRAFAQTLNYAPSVLAMFENDNGIYPETTGTVIMGDDTDKGIKVTGVVKNTPVLANSVHEGIAVARTDVDNLVRRLPLLMRTPDGWVPSYGTKVIQVLANADTYIIKTNKNGIEQIRVKGLPPVTVDSFGRKWVSWVDTPSTSLQELDVEGKFVFIGFSAKGIMPQIATPKGLLEPHKIQAALAESMLIQNSPYIPDYSLALEVGIFVISIISIWILLHTLGITWGITLSGGIFIATAYFGIWTIQKGLLIDVTWTLISQFITAAIAFYYRFREQFKLRQQIKKQFEHYLDPRQIKRLQSDPSLLKLGGEKKEATFLFTDVRGFTSLSEKLKPEEVTSIMNKALTIQSDAVQKYEGMVDKYIGDAMMAIFNAPLDLDNHEDKSILCAKEIQEKIKEADLGIEIGIGINTGEAVIGNMGSNTRFDFSAIGDCVNTAARLESATKEVGEDILIGFSTANKTKIKLKLLSPIKVKGKKDPLNIYTLQEQQSEI